MGVQVQMDLNLGVLFGAAYPALAVSRWQTYFGHDEGSTHGSPSRSPEQADGGYRMLSGH